ncbi:protein of unknown function [Nitrosotalea devaniterrae]|uniref:Uncharacterized protein n=1 Tax=Nitrosotalea devaniterrae TaxID=1078905 RepID=A0A128A249_9ARCH|nr:protein of unknown function [Candidatus Nitrosotalea devanaterra]
MKNISLLIISVIAIVSVFIIYTSYDYYAKPVLISKQQAIDIAIKGIQCKNVYYRLSNGTVVGQLFHIKNNTVFLMDDKNMQDTSLASGYLSRTVKSTDYVWEIGWDCYDATLGQYVTPEDHEWELRFVDAKSGVLLK